jgi:hypothetical protein
MTMNRSALLLAVAAASLLALTAPAPADIVTYDATVVLEWYNSFLGYQVVTADDDATVVIDYTSPTTFDILSIDFDATTSEGQVVLSLMPGTGQNGTIDSTIANVQFGLTGMFYSGNGDRTLDNNGSLFTGIMTGDNGTMFAEGDTLDLQYYAAGVMTPPLGTESNWDWTTDYPTQVIFGPSDYQAVPDADFDDDGDVDLTDYGTFLACYAGPGQPYPNLPNCPFCDFDEDNDVDLADYGVFLGCYNGPNNPPACS